MTSSVYRTEVGGFCAQLCWYTGCLVPQNINILGEGVHEPTLLWCHNDIIPVFVNHI